MGGPRRTRIPPAPRRGRRPLYRSWSPLVTRARRPADRIPRRLEVLDDPPGVYGVDSEDRDALSGLVLALRGGEDAHDVHPRALENARDTGERAGASREGDLDAATRRVGAYEPHERPHDVRGGYDAHEVTVIHDRQAADLPLVHLYRRLFYGVLRPDRRHLLRHLVGDPDALEGLRAIRVAEGGRRRAQVAVGDHAHEPSSFKDGEVTDPFLPAQRQRLRRRRLRPYRHDLSRHRIPNQQHLSLSRAPLKASPSSASPPTSKTSIRKGQRLASGCRRSKLTTDEAGIKAPCPSTSTNSSPTRQRRSCGRASPASAPSGGGSGALGVASSSARSCTRRRWSARSLRGPDVRRKRFVAWWQKSSVSKKGSPSS